MQFRLVSSRAELLSLAPAWDALWERSDVTIPTPQAALLDHWLCHFEPHARFQAVVVEEDGQLLAALPLVAHRLRGVLTTGGMPSNHWTPASDLLLDPERGEEALELLLDGLQRADFPLLWLDFAIVDAPRWLRLVEFARERGWGVDVQPHFRLPRVEIRGTWDEYRRHWSRNHRQNVARYRRKLIDDHGRLTLRWLRPRESDDIEGLLQAGFAIEDRSWKGRSGSSILRTSGMFEYFLGQAKLLAARGELELAFLDAGEQPIAFMYGWRAKEVFHAFKAGYDDEFAAYSPGQLLIHEILERCFEQQSHCVFDCVGPISEATAKWMTSDYIAGRVVLAAPRWLGQAAFFALKHLAPTLRRWRKLAAGIARPTPAETQSSL
jgi:CelD/BcsL family acetyltransferase involved in cellulose biosynthesis